MDAVYELITLKLIMKLLLTIIIAGMLFLPITAFAHCPLCTAGAGLAAIGAKWLGVETASIGVFIGAFAAAIGFWFSRIIKRRFPFQDIILGILSLVLTIWPIAPMMPGYWSYYLYQGGEYGTILNRTYIFSQFITGSIIGAVIMFISPYISKKIAQARGNKLIPYQGMIISFGLLFALALFFEFAL